MRVFMTGIALGVALLAGWPARADCGNPCYSTGRRPDLDGAHTPTPVKPPELAVPMAQQKIWADRLMTDKKQQRACTDLIKQDLGDPASLKVVEWGNADNPKTGYFAIMLTTPEEFVFPAIVRVRNRAGGMEVSTLMCHFAVSNDHLTLSSASIGD